MDLAVHEQGGAPMHFADGPTHRIEAGGAAFVHRIVGGWTGGNRDRFEDMAADAIAAIRGNADAPLPRFPDAQVRIFSDSGYGAASRNRRSVADLTARFLHR